MENYNGFYAEEKYIKGRKLIIVHPGQETQNGHWVIKTEYFDAFPKVQIELLRQGYFLVYIENKTRWHLPEDTEAKAMVVDYMHKNYGLEKRCSVIGMSCGGMHGIYFASKYPEYVSCMYLDAPVVNLLSCPAGLGKGTKDMFPEFEKATGMSLVDLISYRNHPLDHVEHIAELNIPIILVCGDSDSVVPYNENGKLLVKIYRQKNAVIEVIIKNNADHHPHGLEDNTAIIDFINKYAG